MEAQERGSGGHGLKHSFLFSSGEKARSHEVEQALVACEFPLVVWELPTGVVHLANDAAADLIGRSLDGVVGSKVSDLIGPVTLVDQTIAAFSARVVEDVQTQREVRAAGGAVVSVRAWSRSIELAESRAVVSLIVPTAESARLGRDPTAPWRDLVPIAVGIADRDWCIHQISRDVRAVLGTDSADITGSSLLDLVHPEDRSELEEPDDSPLSASAHSRVRVRNAGGKWEMLCVLSAPLGKGDLGARAFALVGPATKALESPSDRVAELEMRLRLIGSEVRAAGLLDDAEVLPSSSDFPQMASLTSRQWEILSRLMRGDRVPTIARELFVSQSTVRNHLTAIFQLFGVHSQAELLAVLRGPIRGQ